MAILIKNMDMPTKCIDCPMCGEESGCCNISTDHYETVDPESRPDWCPLTEVKARKMKIEYPSPISHTRTVIDKIVYCPTKDEISSRTVYNEDGSLLLRIEDGNDESNC